MPTTKHPEPSTRSRSTASRRANGRPNGKVSHEVAELHYRGEAVLRDFEESIARNPLRSALIALGVGFVVGRMWR